MNKSGVNFRHFYYKKTEEFMNDFCMNYDQTVNKNFIANPRKIRVQSKIIFMIVPADLFLIYNKTHIFCHRFLKKFVINFQI